MDAKPIFHPTAIPDTTINSDATANSDTTTNRDRAISYGNINTAYGNLAAIANESPSYSDQYRTRNCACDENYRWRHY